MSRVRTVFVCRGCGAETPRWEGRCPTCGEWNSLDESVSGPALRRSRRDSPTSRIRPLGAPSDLRSSRIVIDLGEVDRVLGGGIVPGSVVLLGGAPGIGKSTLLLQLAGRLREHAVDVLYVSGEESAEQVAMRGARLGVPADVGFLASNELEEVIRALREIRPAVVCVDSIQTISSRTLLSAPGGVAQVRESAAALQREVKELGSACFLVGHVTKGGALAGPRTLEHLVDVVLHFEGQRSGDHRVLRGSKNRFGSVDEMAAFRMDASGLIPVDDPSTLFLTPDGAEASGAAVAIPVHGSRPILAEVQALVARARFSAPQRVCTGFPGRRLAILLAVLEKRAGVALGDQDVFLNVVGGLRVTDPAADLAVVGALLSAGADRPFAHGTAFFGEVGLGGEIRGVSQGEARVRASRGAGLDRVVAPAALAGDLTGRAASGVRFVTHVRDVAALLVPGGDE
ncbi:MAG: DNA repair protein RadA [Candidatus Palauibacterales bacterium]|nr:DNA repair protein RadA [Candidatus Palauibacterales bacterium]